MIDRTTTFSEGRIYRYTLWREFEIGNASYALFLGLNPSTADEFIDDPTVRRCINFAKSWGYGALCMMNIFAYRATDPRVMKMVVDPVGPENDYHIGRCVKAAGVVVAAWGVHGGYRSRDQEVIRLIPTLHCLGETKAGFPRHPLYVKGDTGLKIYNMK